MGEYTVATRMLLQIKYFLLELLLTNRSGHFSFMKYSDGKEVIIGDQARLDGDEGGIVVCSIDRNEYTSKHSKETWRHLKKGVVIEFPKYGLIHFEKPDSDLLLVKRGK